MPHVSCQYSAGRTFAALSAAMLLCVTLLAAFGAAAFAQDAATAEMSEVSDLGQVMSRSVQMVSPSVVRVLVPEFSREQLRLIAERDRRSRVELLQAEELSRQANQRLDAAGAGEEDEHVRDLRRQLKEITDKLSELDGPEFSRQLARLQRILAEIEAARPTPESDGNGADGESEKSPAIPAIPTTPTTPATPVAPEKPDRPVPGDAPEASDSVTPEAEPAAIVPEKWHPRSGIIISDDGYIITSLAGCGRQRYGLQVELSDGRKLDAKCLGEDLRRDVLLLKIEAENLPAVNVVPRDQLRLGQWVMAVGRTLPVSGTTVNKGIISSLNRHAGLALQTDANISHVNFGGLLADIRGRGVAMIAAVDSAGSSASAGQFSDSGIGFAIPLQDILAQIDTLKQGQTIEPPFLGVRFNMARLAAGAEIQETIAGTAAEAAGVLANDIIVELDGLPIESCYQLMHAIGSRNVGDTVLLKVLRGENQTVELSATLRPRPTRYRG